MGLQDIQISSGHDGAALNAVRASAANGKPIGGVVVIQEIFGVTPHIKGMTQAFADAGYDAIAPSFFDRIEPNFHAELNEAGFNKGRAAVGATPWAQVASDIQSAIALLPKPCYAVGFCWGGTASWVAAQRCVELKASACFYGRGIVENLNAAPKIPVMLHYGAQDKGIPPENYEAVRAYVPDAPLYLYDAGHGFCREGSHDYNPAARELAMQRTLDWFARWR